MPSIEEAEVLKIRAYAFLRNAKRLFDEGEYDLAAFSVEQFCQLILKYKLLINCLLYTSPSPRDRTRSRMPSSA